MNKLALIILIATAFVNTLFAQKFKVEPVTNLPSEIKNVNCIEFTNNGTGWFGTGKGLLKYHNGDFKRISDPKNPLSYQINKILLDDKDQVWAGNYSSQLLCFNNDLLLKTIDFKGITGNKKELVTSLTKFHNQIWATTSNGKLLMYSQGNQSTQTLQGPADVTVYSIHLDSIGTKWLGTSDGLYFKARNKKWKRLPQFSKVYGIVSNKEDTWAMGKNNNNQGLILYKLDYDLMIFFLSVDRSQWQDMMFLGTQDKKIRFYDMDFDSEGNMWIGTDNGLILYNPISGEAEYITAKNIEGFDTKKIKVVAVESDNKIWIACSGKEIYKVTRPVKK